MTVSHRTSAHTSTQNASNKEEPLNNEKPTRSPSFSKRSVLLVYRQLFLLQKKLRNITPRISRSSDRLLASIAYPARFLGHVARVEPLLKLSTTIGDYRTLSRVVSTPATIESALSQILDNSNPDTLDRILDYIQAVCGVLYQVFEDLAYLGDKGILRLSKRRAADFWVWSSIAWSIDTFIVLFRAPYYHYVLKKKVNLRSLFVNAAWFPLCYHWSTYDGVFSNDIVGILGSAACWPNLVYQWSQPI